MSGPHGPAQPDGPEKMHVTLVDNGCTEVLASEGREFLRCIRCGASLNVCPVYRPASGHAYCNVYSGPVGAVLSPLLAGKNFPERANLPKVSSRGGACNEGCPVNIPSSELLRYLRYRGKREDSEAAAAGTPPDGCVGLLASQPNAWRAAIVGGKIIYYLATKLGLLPALRAWEDQRTLPAGRGGEFR